ncbi:hypothetical protein A3A15_03725 [Candidatus Giovannonibacteria bacterium RIFCSPLOWO2_01_FULL_43_60]|nr:MAG: hypothetical protein A3A15_03725 [Candidatus Giovannonibacteria bacterium RIFCSPLOWO2_01_FULL_43_60]
MNSHHIDLHARTRGAFLEDRLDGRNVSLNGIREEAPKAASLAEKPKVFVIHNARCVSCGVPLTSMSPYPDTCERVICVEDRIRATADLHEKIAYLERELRKHSGNTPEVEFERDRTERVKERLKESCKKNGLKIYRLRVSISENEQLIDEWKRAYNNLWGRRHKGEENEG